MKKLLIALALFIGLTGISHARDRMGDGWRVTIMTGTFLSVNEGRSYLFGVVNSSGDTTSLGNYSQCFTTNPYTSPGSGANVAGGFGTYLFQATAAVTTAMLFYTTTTVNSVSTSLNNKDSIGDCENCFTEIPATGGLYCLKSANSQGGANVSKIIWSR